MCNMILNILITPIGHCRTNHCDKHFTNNSNKSRHCDKHFTNNNYKCENETHFSTRSSPSSNWAKDFSSRIFSNCKYRIEKLLMLIYYFNFFIINNISLFRKPCNYITTHLLVLNLNGEEAKRRKPRSEGKMYN